MHTSTREECVSLAEIQLVRDGMPDILPMQGRSAGIHVSELIHQICVQLGHYKETDEPMNMARMELGNAWEHALIQRFHLDHPDRYMQPEELELNGVFGTPDLLDLNESADCEIKCSFMSSKHGPGSEKFFKYETQLKAYLHMLGWTRGYLHVCFVNGDYTFKVSGGPVYRVWRYDFTKMELEMNWLMLMKQAAKQPSK